MKIIDYKIIIDSWVSNLEIEIIKSIKNGWQPSKGIWFEDIGSSRWYYQAMVKYEESTLEKPLMTHVKISEDPQKEQKIYEEEAKPTVLIELLSCPKCGTKVMKKPKND